MPLNINLKAIKATDIFIETGLLRGDGVKKALQAGFGKVVSIEMRKESIEHCILRFAKAIENGRVRLFHGKSEEILQEIISEIDEPITFFLDAHLGEKHIETLSDEESFEQRCPLYNELKAIGEHPIKSHVILIDDIDQIKTQRSKHKWVREVEPDEIENLIREINPDYTISLLNNKILYARL